MERKSNVAYGHTLYHVGAWALLILLALFASCSSLKEKSLKYAGNHPDEFAKFCADAFPVKDSVGEPAVIYLEADNKNYTNQIDSLKGIVDSLETSNEADTTDCGAQYRPQIKKLSDEIRRLKNNYVPCKPDTMQVTTTVFKENTARVKALSDELSDRNDELNKSKESSAKKNWWIVGLALLAAISIVLLIRK